MSNPGLIFVQSRIYKPDQLSPALFAKWYDEVHVRDIMSTGGIHAAVRWACADPKAERPYLTLYPLDDLDFLRTPQVKAIPVHSDILPGPSHYIWDFVAFDARVYKHLQTFEPEGTKAGPGDLLMVFALTPKDGMDEDLDAWYRQEHCAAMAKCTGYRRSRRYRVHYNVPQERKEGTELPPASTEEPPVYLVLHEFDGEALPQTQIDAAAETEWGKKVVSGLIRVEADVFKLLRAHGDIGKRW